MDADERRHRIGGIAEGAARCLWAGSGCAAGQDGAVAAEGEHGQRDQRLGGAEAERDAGQHPDLGVDSISPWDSPWSRAASIDAR